MDTIIMILVLFNTVVNTAMLVMEVWALVKVLKQRRG